MISRGALIILFGVPLAVYGEMCQFYIRQGKPPADSAAKSRRRKCTLLQRTMSVHRRLSAPTTEYGAPDIGAPAGGNTMAMATYGHKDECDTINYEGGTCTCDLISDEDYEREPSNMAQMEDGYYGGDLW